MTVVAFPSVLGFFLYQEAEVSAAGTGSALRRGMYDLPGHVVHRLYLNPTSHPIVHHELRCQTTLWTYAVYTPPTLLDPARSELLVVAQV
jgi:hypothetical protein